MRAIQIIIISGIANIIFLLLVAFSCRCVGLYKLTKRWFNNDKYMKFYKYHCYYWYGFFLTVIVHTITAFYLIGWPF